MKRLWGAAIACFGLSIILLTGCGELDVQRMDGQDRDNPKCVVVVEKGWNTTAKGMYCRAGELPQ